MTYDQALEYLHTTKRLGWRPGLDIMRELISRLGNPQDHTRFIHIAGTNGKGSTTAMAAAVLKEAGYKTGMYISPYVDDFRERIQFDGHYIEKADFAGLMERIIPVMDGMVADGLRHPTEYETLTAAAFLYFYEKQADYVALEVGLGGSLDMTNIIDPPEIAAITSISLDHMEYLGDTVEEIALNKCGIIKSGSASVTYCDQPPEAYKVIVQNCRDKNVPLTTPDMKQLKINRADLRGSDFTYKGEDYTLNLAGAHQIYNALTVIEIFSVLAQKGIKIPGVAIRKGIAATRFSGRLEIVREQPLFILDGAHNESGVKALCAAIDGLMQDKRVVVMMGMNADKDYINCIGQVAARAAEFIAVSADTPRALSAAEAAQVARQTCQNVYCPASLANAVTLAFKLADADDIILACGSLYMISDVKKIMRDT